MFFFWFWLETSAIFAVVGYVARAGGYAADSVSCRWPIWLQSLLWPVYVAWQLTGLLIVFWAALQWAGNGVWEVLWDAVRPRGR